MGVTAANAFWWQWPWRRMGWPAGFSLSSKRPALASRATNSSNSSACSDTSTALSPRPITSASSRNVSRHDGSRPTIAMPRRANGSRASISASAFSLARATWPPARNVRPQQWCPPPFSTVCSV